MIYAGSRYTTAEVAVVESDRGWNPSAFRTTISPVGVAVEYVLPQNENFQHLAHILYGDAEMWWRIADENPDILYPDNIPAGTVVRVPNALAIR